VNVEAAESTTRIAYGGARAIPDDGAYFTRCFGKHLIAPPPVEQSGIWPFEPARSHASFIIGTGDDGNAIEHTCDPAVLSNYFGANPGAPHFLTPVFFRRAVLDKYYANPDRYRVTDGYLLAGGVWSLPLDNALDEHVAVFVGDLGRLPDREQAYWKSFNVAPGSGLSDIAVRRSFLGQFADTDRIEYRFTLAYTAVNEVWTRRFGWPLFKELHPGDAHLAHSLHVPTNPGFAAFDAQLIGLAKLVVDCLNEEELAKNTTKTAGEKGIGKLERFVQDHGLSASRNPLCTTLRQIQGARSRSSAHRKGSDFDEALLRDGAPDLPTLFEDLLSSLATHSSSLALSWPRPLRPDRPAISLHPACTPEPRDERYDLEDRQRGIAGHQVGRGACVDSPGTWLRRFPLLASAVQRADHGVDGRGDEHAGAVGQEGVRPYSGAMGGRRARSRWAGRPRS
jgi:hypothetical protein